MKAILVIDMPQTCDECPLVVNDECMKERKNNKPKACPLRPIPDEASNILLKGLDHMEELKNVKVHYFNDLMEDVEWEKE